MKHTKGDDIMKQGESKSVSKHKEVQYVVEYDPLYKRPSSAKGRGGNINAHYKRPSTAQQSADRQCDKYSRPLKPPALPKTRIPGPWTPQEL
jgi:hypothetical protein